MKLTAATIRTIVPVPPKTDIIEFDDAVPGFGVRARKGGSKVYVVQYTIGEKTRRMSLGKVELQGVDKARDKAKDILAAVRMGQDPAGEKQRDRTTATDTFKAVADRFLAFQKTQLRPRSYDDVERHLMMHGKSLHGLLLAKIQRQDIASVISVVRAKGAAVTANRVRATLSSFFSWAISEGLVDNNPVTGTLRTEEKSRERVLSFDELRTDLERARGRPFRRHRQTAGPHRPARRGDQRPALVGVDGRRRLYPAARAHQERPGALGPTVRTRARNRSRAAAAAGIGRKAAGPRFWLCRRTVFGMDRGSQTAERSH